ncbi:hypothetical protein [Stenotrophomonas hibiscicola]
MNNRIRLPRSNAEWDIDTGDRYNHTRLTASVVVNGQRCSSSVMVDDYLLARNDHYGDRIVEDVLRGLEHEVGRMVVRGSR